MKIHRGARTGNSWECTDSKSPSEYATNWMPGKIIVFDGTIYKEGMRHTDIGIELEENDILALIKAIIRGYKEKSRIKPNPAFMKPMKISGDLAAIVGSKPIPRTEVTKKLWKYIKKNKLQDSKNKRNINTDAALKKIFKGKAQVSMFEMTKLVSNHLS